MKKLQTTVVFFYAVSLFFLIQVEPLSPPAVQTHSWKTSLFVGAAGLAVGAVLHRFYTMHCEKKELQLESLPPLSSVRTASKETQTEDEKSDEKVPLRRTVSFLIGKWEEMMGGSTSQSSRTSASAAAAGQRYVPPRRRYNSVVDFGQEILRQVLAFSGGETDNLELDPRHLAKLSQDTVIQGHFEQLRQNREDYHDLQGRIFGVLADHVRDNYFRKPGAGRSPRPRVSGLTFKTDTGEES